MIRRSFLFLLCLIISAISYDARGADACEVTITTRCYDTYYVYAPEVCSRCPQLGYDSSGNAVYQTGGANNTGGATSCQTLSSMPNIVSCHKGYYFESGECKKCIQVIGYTSDNKEVIGSTTDKNTGGADSCTNKQSHDQITSCPTNWKFVKNQGLNTSVCEKCPEGMVTSTGPHQDTECKTIKEQNNCNNNQYWGTDGTELAFLKCIDCPVIGKQNGVEVRGQTTDDKYVGIDSCVAPAGTYKDTDGNTFEVPTTVNGQKFTCYVETGGN